jgi:glycine/D-amino acid oxidase-like deaminating enzyme/nitrite reductase/ring-hydroxylating ferredoxin subunit
MNTRNFNDAHGVDELPGKPVSLWLATTPETDFPAMSKAISVDVAVVGGGIAGIATAFLLKQAGVTVAVVEAGRVVESVTGNTTAKIASLHNLIYDYLISQFGEDGARQYADAQTAAIDKIASLVEENKISCDFRRTPAYTYTEEDVDLDQIKAEVKAATKLGLPASYVETTPLPFPIKGAVKFENQAQFHPRKYLLALAEKLPGEGSYVFEGTRALEIEVGDSCRVKTNRGTITAKSVIITTHFPFQDPNIYFAAMHPGRSLVLGCRLDGPVPEGMYINTGEEMHSFRSNPTEDGDEIWMVGGEKFKTGQGGDIEERFKRLEIYARGRFRVRSIEYRWATQDNFTVDRVPYIGKLSTGSKNLYVATGFCGWGMTNSHVAAMILADAVRGGENPWATLFDPSRFKPVTSAKDFVKENLNVAKEFMADRVSTPELDGLDKLPAGRGEVVEWKGEKAAIYKDEQGAVHAVSPLCTHMKCIVHWNNAEKSWDCPCHGSRFNFDGKVIQGPANEDLAPVQLKADGELST